MKSKLIAVTAALLVGGFASTAAFAAETVGEKIDDVSVLTKVKAELLNNKQVDGLDVNVDVKEGRVTLSGTASNEAERAKAVQIATTTKGVKSVDNQITLKSH
jgi:hyperosmotically inducible periplasmic protein